MVSVVTVFRSALVAVVLFVLAESGANSAAQKIAPCCTRVSRQPLAEPITGFVYQKTAPPCLKAVIFFTQSGFHCSLHTAPWVKEKILKFLKEKASTPAPPPPTVSLLSIITSSSSSARPSSSSSVTSKPAVVTSHVSSSSSSGGSGGGSGEEP